MTGRNGLVSLVALVLTGTVVGLIVVGCGIRPTAVIHGQDAPKGAVSSMIVYLLDHGALRAVARPLPATPTASPDETNKTMPWVSAGTQALNALLQGPTSSEAAGGLTSDVPANVFGTIVRGSSSDGSVIQVYIKTDGTPLTQHAVDQITCTVITAQLTDGNSNTSGFQVAVYDGSNQSRTPQGCPLTTP